MLILVSGKMEIDTSIAALITEGIQQNSSTMYGTSTLADEVRELGPAAYQAFPTHHFFARVYRPSAVSIRAMGYAVNVELTRAQVWAALLNRQPTFLCNPEWTVVPWEHYPRICLDDLLDVAVLLPSIYSRADHILLPETSTNRKPVARELLDDCVNIQMQFDIWHDMVRQKTRSPYWIGEGSTYIPFNEPLSFDSPSLCLAFVYYWTVLIGFHQCIYALLQIINKPEDGIQSPGMATNLPPALDPRNYQPAETRKLAALACRSLDFALQTTLQPDLLIAPTWIIKEFFGRMNAIGLCELESLWVNEFNERLEVRTREMRAWLEDKRWARIG